MAEKNNVRILLTDRATSALDEIITKFRLEENPDDMIAKLESKQAENHVILALIAKSYVAGDISKEQIPSLVQEKISVQDKVANQISKDILDTVIPEIEKVSEKDLQDPVFSNKLANKLFGDPLEVIEEVEILPENISEKKPIVEEKTFVEEKSSLPKTKPIIQPKQNRGPDRYRESLE